MTNYPTRFLNIDFIKLIVENAIGKYTCFQIMIKRKMSITLGIFLTNVVSKTLWETNSLLIEEYGLLVNQITLFKN